MSVEPISKTAGPAGALPLANLGTMTNDEQRRCLEIGKRIPSLRWWYSLHEKLGCSPREAVDAGRFADVEAILPNTKLRDAERSL